MSKFISWPTLKKQKRLRPSTPRILWEISGLYSERFQELFEKQYADQVTAISAVAERLRALGFPAPRSYTDFSNLAGMTPPDRERSSSEEMIQELICDHEAIAAAAHF